MTSANKFFNFSNPELEVLDQAGRRATVNFARNLGFLVLISVVKADEVSPIWQVNYTAIAKNSAAVSAVVPMDGESVVVTVVSAGVNAETAQLQDGTKSLDTKIIGYDPISRLQFIQAEGGKLPKRTTWNPEIGGNVTVPLKAIDSAGAQVCRATSWINQVKGKILPLALLRIDFARETPLPGTPIVDEAGRIVAIVFQSSENQKIGYAIPAEAVHRVWQDLRSHGKFTRGWLGLALQAESQLPRISRVLPDSPAAAADIKVNDIILNIGSRKVRDYGDVVNAFFYLVPDQPIRVRLLRDSQQLEFTLTPTHPMN